MLPVNGQINQENLYVELLMDRACTFSGHLTPILPHQLFNGNPPERPMWITQPVNSNFPDYAVYLELSHGRRYYILSLTELHSGRRHRYPHYPIEAQVVIQEHTYLAFAENFRRYVYNATRQHPQIESDESGCIYLTIKGCRDIYYANLARDS